MRATNHTNTTQKRLKTHKPTNYYCVFSPINTMLKVKTDGGQSSLHAAYDGELNPFVSTHLTTIQNGNISIKQDFIKANLDGIVNQIE